jgi:allantoinase
MSETYVIKSKKVACDGRIAPLQVHIQDQKIKDVVAYEHNFSDVKVVDCGDLVVMPGLVDTHVHVNEPGRTEWEGFATATRAAARGGITTIVDMPLNCMPVTTSAKAFEVKLKAVKGKLSVDAGFYGGLVPGNNAELKPLAELGVLGFKAFMVHSGIDDFPKVSAEDFRAAMPIIKKLGVPLLAHAELECPISKPSTGSDQSYQTFLDSRPHDWECEAIKLLIALCEETRCPVHVVHLSSSEALPILQKARAKGLPITVETCPHYLVFNAEGIMRGDTRFKCTPPIRENANREKLWAGLKAGIIDFVVSDHSPCTPVLKKLEEGSFTEAWGGIASLQFGLSSIWTEAKARGIELPSLVSWLSTGPAKFVGLTHKKGQIAKGFDADLVVWDPDSEVQITSEHIEHRHKLTPYEGKKLFGLVKETYLRGKRIYSDKDGFLAKPAGEALLRKI